MKSTIHDDKLKALIQRAVLYELLQLVCSHYADSTRITGNTIVVIVGQRENSRSFFIHCNLICTFSPFFNAACSGFWKESQESVVKLPEDYPEIFELYVKWLYTGELVKLSTNAEEEDYPEHTTLTVLACAWFLGDKLLDSTFKNAAIDAIIERVRETNHYPCALASFIYENTTEESPLRRLLVDFYAYAYERSWFVGNDRGPDMDDAPREFFRDVLVKIIMLKEGPAVEEPGDWPWVKDRCQYHDHADGTMCVFPVL